MPSTSLAGRSILIVEDESLIALDIRTVMELAGAHVIIAASLRHARPLIATDGLSAAVVAHALQDGDGSELCELLKECGIPFVIYSGFSLSDIDGARKLGPHVVKPASPSVLVRTIEGLLRAQPISN
jgi:DNA-binding response OmpR family regulator